MAYRFAAPCPPGTLFKGAKRKPLDMGRKPRVRDAEHLDAIRQCSCVKCGLDHGCEAAHIRITRVGKPISGIGNKPDDKFTTSLCHDCHLEQHRVGEVPFWNEIGIDPLRLAEALYRLSPNVEAMRAASARCCRRG